MGTGIRRPGFGAAGRRAAGDSTDARGLLAGLAGELDRHPSPWTLAGVSRDRASIVFRSAGQEVLLPSEGLYGFLMPGEPLGPARLEALVAALDQRLARLDDLPLDLVVAELLPQVRSRVELADRSPGSGPGSVLHRPLGAGLEACTVLDDGDGMVFVTEAHLAHWGLAPEAVRNLAVANLRSLTGPLPRPGPDEVLRLRQPLAYAAALALLLPLDGGPRLAVPDRDLLLLAGSAVPDDRLAVEIAQAFRDAGHPISDRLLERRQGLFVAMADTGPVSG